VTSDGGVRISNETSQNLSDTNPEDGSIIFLPTFPKTQQTARYHNLEYLNFIYN